MHCASLERMVVWTGLVILGISVIARALPARAAEEGPAAPAAAAKAEAPAPAAKPAARRGAAREGRPAARLPSYFSEIVTEEQREKIYAIQKQFAAKIDPLTREIEKLRQARDGEIEALLTPEQKKKLDELRAAAKAKREANRPPRGGRSGRSSRSPAPGNTAPAAPPAK
jgi:hypothetical protein